MRTENLAKLLGRPVELQPTPFTGQYPNDVLSWEMLKGALGLAICVGIIVFLSPSPWVSWPLGAIAVLFALYLTQQVRRFPVRMEVDDGGVARVKGTRRENLRWIDLRKLRLHYYPNGRKASTGTLVLVLDDGRHRFKVDSSLDGFPTLLSRAAQAAREQELELHPTTESNLAQLGL